jgi:excisionase family DNA binding protein
MSQIALSITEVCRALSIGRTKAYELINDGELETFKIGRRTLVTVRSLEALFDRSTGQRPC